MVKEPIFIVSFDCEGKWGVDGFGLPSAHITSPLLATTYRQICEVLDAYQVAATFAYVAALTLTPQEARDHLDLFTDGPWQGGNWYARFLQSLAENDGDGWLCPEALDVVVTAQRHEIASHGFSHIPLGEQTADRALFSLEMRKLRVVEALKGYKSSTFIYPCNHVGHAQELRQSGFIGYRPPRPAEMQHGTVARIGRLLDEVNPFEPPMPQVATDDLSQIPAGRFINRRCGLRALIPSALTAYKVDRMVDRAIRDNKVVHLYAHPHDFIAGANHLDLFERILKTVARRASNGDIRVMTQAEYAAAVSG